MAAVFLSSLVSCATSYLLLVKQLLAVLFQLLWSHAFIYVPLSAEDVVSNDATLSTRAAFSAEAAVFTEVASPTKATACTNVVPSIGVKPSTEAQEAPEVVTGNAPVVCARVVGSEAAAFPQQLPNQRPAAAVQPKLLRKRSTKKVTISRSDSWDLVRLNRKDPEETIEMWLMWR